MMKATTKQVDKVKSQDEIFYDTKRDLNPFWSSSLFSDVYLKNDFPREYNHLWDNDEIGGFYSFYQGFINLCHDLENEAFDNWNEADTIHNWIVPVMGLLGWENNSTRNQKSYIDNSSFTLEERGKKQVYRPDLIYFDLPEHKIYTQKQKDNESKLREVRDLKTGAKVIVEAKYWNRLSTQTDKYKTKESSDSAVSLGPELQTLKYMELARHDFGILTDGKSWKIFHKEFSNTIERRCFEFDLGNLKELALDLKAITNEQKYRHYAKYFYFFFCKDSFLGSSEKTRTAPLLVQVFEYSKRYAHSIEENLKKRFMLTMGIVCNSFKESALKNKSAVDLDTIRNVSESHIFNILFVKFCEVRKILPIQSLNYLRLSLHEVVEALAEMKFDPQKNWDDFLRDFRFGDTFGGKHFSFENHDLYDRFINLYEIIHDGVASSKDFGFEISGFKESIFSPEEWRFAKIHKLSNRDMISILFNLNFIDSTFPDRKYQQIPYSFFTPRQLGSIYESFLEFRLEKASTDMVFMKGCWSEANLKSSKVQSLSLVDQFKVRKGDLFFCPNNEDRKMSGSYYTPDHVVRYMVQNSLGKLVKPMTSKELLDVRVCDPSMGSGHFLAGALEFLTSVYREKVSDETLNDVEESYSETARKILDKCILGLDLNPRAVKLSKLSLWLLTAYPGRKLERLDDQLVCGDALFDLGKLGKEVTAYIGNPPYINSFILSKNEEYKNRIKSSYESATGAFDICALFFEACNKASPGARICFILPNKLLSTENSKGMRDYIFKSDIYVEQIDDLSVLNIFEGASVYPVILTLGRSRVATVKTSRHANVDLSSPEIETREPDTSSSQAFFRTLTQNQVLNFDRVKLGDHCEILAAATVDEAYGIKTAITEKSSGHSLKFIVSGNIMNFGITWGAQKTQYLKTTFHSPFLDITKKNVPQRRRDQYQSEKILIPNMTTILKAYHDRRGDYAPGVSTTMIMSSGIDLGALSAYLNSSLSTEIYKDMYETQHLNGGALRVGAPQLKDLEIPSVLLDKSVQKDLAELNKRITAEVDRLMKKEKIAELKRVFESDSKDSTPSLRKLHSLVDELNSYVRSCVKLRVPKRKAS